MMKRSLSDLDSSSRVAVKRSRSDRFDLEVSILDFQGIDTPNDVFLNLRRYLVESAHQDYFLQHGGFLKLCSLLSLTTDKKKQASMLEVLLTITRAHHQASIIELGKSQLAQLLSMAEQDDSLVVNQQAVRLLAAIALNVTPESDFYKPENIQRLEQLMVAADDVVRTLAMETLQNLLQNDACQDLALSPATIASLFSLREPADPVMEENLLEMMLQLSKNQANFSGIQEAGGMRFLVESLDQPRRRKTAISVLARLSTSMTNHRMMRESGVIPVLISCLQDHSDALMAMCFLAKNTDNHAIIHANQCVEALVQLTISQKNYRPLSIICLLAKNKEYTQDISAKLPIQILSELTHCLRLKDQNFAEGAFILFREIKLEITDLQTVRKNGGINALVKFLLNFERRGQAVKLLIELVKDKQSLQILFKENGMTHLIPLLTDSDTQTQQDATILLQALQTCHPASQQTHQQVSMFKTIPYESLHFTEKKLGRGGFGQVVRGEWLQHTPVAIKTLVNARASKAELQKLKNEGILHSSLKHPNIVALYGAYQTPEQYGLVLELMSGNLSKIIKKLTSTKRQAYAMDISRGLAYLNTELVVHGDLKPQNILIEGGRAKLADFGLSIRLASKRELTTGQVTQVCTWNYAAPEVVQYHQASFSSDIWSFSMVLWHMATGTLPYRECSHTCEIKQRIQAGETPGTLQAVEEKTSKPYADLIAACWESRAQDRPSIQSVAESVSRLPK
ncbi:MAG: protein kinase [Legionellaceae bacterium]|nr:protein kinase [Legionellaceae bacterium]